MSKKKWHTSPWTIALGSALFSFLLPIAYDALRNKPILTSVSIIFGYLWSLLLAILNFPIKLWWILAAIVIVVGVISIIAKFSTKERINPDLLTYREGKPKRWRWTWEWKFNHSKNAWVISKLTAHCPKCDSTMIDNSSFYGPNFSCPLCEFQAISDYECDEPHKIEQIILDNIERMRQGKSIIG